MNKNINKLGLKCSILISDFNEWKCRNDYKKLMEDFLRHRISLKEFDREFLNIWEANNDKNESWEEFIFIITNFKLNQFDGFSSLTSKLFEYLDIVETDTSLNQHYQINEEQFKEYVKIILLEMENKYC